MSAADDNIRERLHARIRIRQRGEKFVVQLDGIHGTILYRGDEASANLHRANTIDTLTEIISGEPLPQPSPLSAAPLEEMSTLQFENLMCKARAANTGANDPQDCSWPFCGCDPHADRVIEALEEMDLLKSRVAPQPAPPSEELELLQRKLDCAFADAEAFRRESEKKGKLLEQIARLPLGHHDAVKLARAVIAPQPAPSAPQEKK